MRPVGHYAYSAQPTRNPFRYLLAVWRIVRDPTATHEAGIVQIGFARSRLGRRFARWDEVAATLRRDPRMAAALVERRPCERIDLESLARLPEGTLGRIFADHCRARGLDPNLVYVPPTGEVDWMLHHLYGTHDLWHVMTGWGNDEVGEYGLGAFYMGQLGAPPFFGFFLSIVQLGVVLRRKSTAEFVEALVAGYEMGKQAEPLLGADWSALWAFPIGELRARYGIRCDRLRGEGIRAAA